MPARWLLVALAGVLLTARGASAQPVGVTHWTIEARVAQASTVAVGTISRVTRLIEPDERRKYQLELKLDEVLKGDPRVPSEELDPIRFPGDDDRYEQWSAARTSCLFFIGPKRSGDEQREWDLLPLGPPVPAERIFVPRKGPPMFAADLSVLRDLAAVVRRAREFARAFSKPLPIQRLRIPASLAMQSGRCGAWNDLFVPVEPSLEARARRFISSPAAFMPPGTELDAHSRYLLRSAGIAALRHFRSAANGALFRELLADSHDEFETFLPTQPVRALAFEALLHWRMPAPLPKWPEAITTLDLSRSGVTDAGLKRVAGLENLVTLELQGARVSPRGFRALMGLKNLNSLDLDEAQVSDAVVSLLRQSGKLHLLAQATGEQDGRAVSEDQVTALALCRTPVTNAGLRHLAPLKRLAWLDLRDTRITDAGLPSLTGFKHLKRLLLHGTAVTAVAIDRLQRALPGCEITFGR